MTLDRLVEELRRRAEDELKAETARQEAERAHLLAERDRQLAEIRESARTAGERDAARERTQRIASARLAARKLTYEAREREMGEALAQTRELLRAYTRDSEYPAALKRMVATAVDQLGRSIKVYGRAEDASALKAAAGKSFDDRSVAILGGLIAETSDGSRRLNLSLDELLRRREDGLRELLGR